MAARALYDPIKAIEGMFNGSVTRIGYALKDPVGYSGSTKTVLVECAKKFHDALDDCEIQLLDAKWYLEQQLRTNRLRREAKAREIGVAAKRKHEEMKEVNESDVIEQTAAKKAKTDGSEQTIGKDQSNAKNLIDESNPEQTNGASVTKELSAQRSQQENKQPDKDHKVKDNQPTQPLQAAPKPAEAPKPPQKEQQPPTQPVPQGSIDDFAKPTPQATPTGTNDDYFESMFGEPTADLVGDSNKDENDLNFDFTMDMPESENQDLNSLDSLLPGVGRYANIIDDAANNTTITTTNNNDDINNTNTNNNNNNNNASVPDTNNLQQTSSNDFDLPDYDYGGPNMFDDFLNDDGMVGDNDGNLDNIDLTDPGTFDMDFDSFN